MAPATGAANRAAFDDELARRCQLATAGGDGFALIMVDVDHFKRVNDEHGHAVGDRVLTGLVAFLRPRVRRDDLIARWGGEEFAVVLPGASTRAALKKAAARAGRHRLDHRRRPHDPLHRQRRRHRVEGRRRSRGDHRPRRPRPVQGQARRPQPRRARLTVTRAATLSLGVA